MPALDPIVTNYLTQVKGSLKPTSADPNRPNATPGPGVNYLRAQDMAAVLQLLTDATDPGAAVTATGGSTTTVTVAAAVANSQVGNTVTFAGNVTAALTGVTATVVSNTGTTLTFAETLPGTPAAGDTFTVTVAFMDAVIDAVSDGASLGNSPVDVYSLWRTVLEGANRLAVQTGSTLRELNANILTQDTGAGSTTSSVVLDLGTKKLLTDELKGYRVDVTGFGSATITGNTEDGVLAVSTGLTGSAGAGVSCTVVKSVTDTSVLNLPNPHPGGQPGWNAMLSDIIAQLEASVTAYTVIA